MAGVVVQRHWTTAHHEHEWRHGRQLQAMWPPAWIGSAVLQPQFRRAATVVGESWNHGLAELQGSYMLVRGCYNHG